MKFGLLGYPLRYSLSPAIQQAAFRAAGMEAAYLLWPTQTEELAERVEALRRSPQVVGWNVTVPHKAAIMPLLDRIAPGALAVGAVNTVFREGARLVGENTDLSGFCVNLEEAGVPVAGQPALVLGAGGAARAICHGLLGLGADRLYLANRTEARAEQLLGELAAGRPENAGALAVVVPANALTRLGREVRLVVNCTASQDPWAAFGFSAEEFWSSGEGWAVDLAYGRMLAGFLPAARQCGWRTLSGEGMLLWQAAHAWQIWTGKAPPIEVMRRALAAALNT